MASKFSEIPQIESVFDITQGSILRLCCLILLQAVCFALSQNQIYLILLIFIL